MAEWRHLIYTALGLLTVLNLMALNMEVSALSFWMVNGFTALCGSGYAWVDLAEQRQPKRSRVRVFTEDRRNPGNVVELKRAA